MKTSIRNTWILLLAGLLLAQIALGNANAADTTPPTLVSSSPVNGANNVPLDSKVIFTFSEAMQVPADFSQAIMWIDAGQLVPANFNYSWSADAKTLSCAYSGPLPAADAISWFLSNTEFLDLAGNSMDFSLNLVGTFTTTSGGSTNDCSGTSSSGNFTSYSLFKSARYVQNSASASTPDTSTDPYSFMASVNLATNRTATAVTLTVPGGSPQPMSSFFGGSYFLVDSTNDLSKLDALYPPGNYTFTVTGSPNQIVPANLPANAIPNAPHLSNYAAAQTINAGAAFTLRWDAFVGGRAIDSISVQVYNSSPALVFQITNSAGCPSVLPGTATSVVIPANTLMSNQTYTAHLLFLKNISTDTNSFPGSVVFVGGESATEMTIATGTGGLVPPAMILTHVVWLPAGQFQFQFATVAGTSYTVDYTTDLANPLGWTPLLSTNATGGLIQITDTPPPGTPLRAYRTRHN